MILENQYPVDSANTTFYYPGPDETFWYIHDDFIDLIDSSGNKIQQIKNKPGSRIFPSVGHVYTYSTDPNDPSYIKPRSLLNGTPPPKNNSGTQLLWENNLFGNVFPLPSINATVFGPDNLLLESENQKVDLLNFIGKELRGKSYSNKVFDTSNDLGYMVSTFLLLDENILALTIKDYGFVVIELSPKKFENIISEPSIRGLTWVDSQTLWATSALNSQFVNYDLQTKKTKKFNFEKITTFPWRFLVLNDELWYGSKDNVIYKVDRQLNVINSYSAIKNKKGSGIHVNSILPKTDSLFYFSNSKGVY